jgi:hypothetical protein
MWIYSFMKSLDGMFIGGVVAKSRREDIAALTANRRASVIEFTAGAAEMEPSIRRS